jgi:hypothetical protein
MAPSTSEFSGELLASEASLIPDTELVLVAADDSFDVCG